MKRMPLLYFLFLGSLLLIACDNDDPAPPTLSAPTITGLFQPEGELSISFTNTGTFASGNIFTAQLSDASGNFTNPIAIGTLTAVEAGTIEATLPAGVANGTGYRIRVVASKPETISPDNGTNLSISAPTITIVGVDTSPSGQTFIEGRSVVITYTTTGVFSQNNSFGIELSNTTGTYSAQIEGGSTTATTRTITLAGFPLANDYRFRLKSSSPVVYSSYSSTFSFVKPSLEAPSITGNLTAGGNVTITVPYSNGPFSQPNSLSLELSDAAGNFSTSPIVLSTLVSTLTASGSQQFNVTLPSTIAAGNGYKVRLVATYPSVVSPSSASFTISPLPTLNLEPSSPSFTKMYSGTTDYYYYSFKLTRNGNFNPSTNYTIEMDRGVGGFFGLNSTNLAELQNTGTTNVVVSILNKGTGSRRFRATASGHAGVFSNETEFPVFQTGITSVGATIEGSANNFATSTFVRGLASSVYNNNQIVSIGGNNSTTLFGAQTVRMEILLNLSSENVVTGSQTARVIVQLFSSTGSIAVYNNNSVTLNVSGNANGYTISGVGPFTLSRTSGSAGNTSISVQNVSASFRMQ